MPPTVARASSHDPATRARLRLVPPPGWRAESTSSTLTPTDAVAPVQGALALDWRADAYAAAVPSTAGLRLVGSPAGVDDNPSAIDVPGDPSIWIGRIAQGIVDALDGTRPLHQLTRWTTTGVYQTLARAVDDATRRRAAPQRGTAPRATPDRTRRAHSQVRSLRMCRVSDIAVEASVTLRTAERVRALALRAEHHRGRWHVVAIALG